MIVYQVFRSTCAGRGARNPEEGACQARQRNQALYPGKIDDLLFLNGLNINSHYFGHKLVTDVYKIVLIGYANLHFMFLNWLFSIDDLIGCPCLTRDPIGCYQLMICDWFNVSRA